MKFRFPSAPLKLWMVLALAPATGLPARAASEALTLARQLNQAFIELAEAVSPSVVVIRVARKHPRTELGEEDSRFFDMLPREFRRRLEEERRRQQRREPEGERDPVFDGQGSGIVIRKEGYILTNRHVVEDAAEIKVRFRDGTEFDAQVRGSDPQSDLAVIKIDPGERKLAIAALGDSTKTRVGELVMAVGAPFELDYSVTFGHVSAKGRSRILNDPSMDQDFLQTDANINPGNSGGPLVNLNGEVIGINTLIRGLNSGIGFSIPINLAREVADQLVTEGRFVRAYLGVKIRALTEDTEFRDRLKDVSNGVVVVEIPRGGPAAKSDLKPGDVIMNVDGQPVSTAQELRNAIRTKGVNKPVTLDVHRFGKRIKVNVTPEAWPEDTVPLVTRNEPPAGEQTPVFGMTLRTLTQELAEQFNVDKVDGVIVAEVEEDSEAGRKGIQPGDIITEVNQKPVKSPRDFRLAVEAGDAKRGIVVNFISGGARKFEILKDAGE